MRRAVPFRLIVLGAMAVVLAITLGLSLGRIGGAPEGVSPEALRRIEAKNRGAALNAAADLRTQSQVQAEAADREAALRDSGNNAAPLTRFETANGAAPH